jgi:hypothetical protein
LTVRLNVLDDDAPAASVTVTVNVVVASVAVGVPLTCPLLELKIIPLASVPPVSANVYGGIPPLAVTGVKAACGTLTVPVVLATACVVVSRRGGTVGPSCVHDQSTIAATEVVTQLRLSAATADRRFPFSFRVCPVSVLLGTITLPRRPRECRYEPNVAPCE